MSLVLFIGFLLFLNGRINPEYFTDEYFIAWALFSIADALWLYLPKIRKGR